jgi:hypothetical protein
MPVIGVVLHALSIEPDGDHVITVAVAGQADRVASGDKQRRPGVTVTFEARRYGPDCRSVRKMHTRADG